MRSLSRQDEYSYKSNPHPPQNDSYVDVGRLSHKMMMMDKENNKGIKMIRPSSTTTQQQQQVPRQYSSSYDKRGYLQQMQVVSAPVLKKPIDMNRTSSIKKEQNMKYSLLVMDKQRQAQRVYQSIEQLNTETENTNITTKRTHDYQEYKKLQDKLQYLENKIISIKSNIDHNNQALLLKNSNRTTSTKPKGLTAKFFGNRPNTSTIEQPKASHKQTASKHKQEQSSPSLSQFITQFKPNQPIVPQKRKETYTPTSAVPIKKTPVNETTKKSMNRKPSIQELQKYSSVSSLLNKEIKPIEAPFLYYISSLIKAYMSQESTKINDQNREHLMQTIQAIQFSKQMKQTPIHVIEERKSYLTKKEHYRNKKTLIFDLDETLIHCNESSAVPGDVYLPIKFPTGELIEV